MRLAHILNASLPSFIQIKHILGINAARSENFVIGKQGLRRQPFAFGDKQVTTIAGYTYALQNNRIEQFGIEDDGVLWHLKRQIIWVESNTRFAGDLWIATN